MRFFSKTDSAPSANSAPVDGAESVDQHHSDTRDVEKNAALADSDADADHNVQAGVKKVEAMASVWPKSHLIAAYVIIWFIYFVTAIQEVVVRTLNPFVTSSFQRHSLTAAVSIMSSVIGGLTKLPLAKILDTWGRPQGLALMLLIWVLGYVMMAACPNVETYAAAQVFSTVG
jgi:fucose permease